MPPSPFASPIYDCCMSSSFNTKSPKNDNRQNRTMIRYDIFLLLQYEDINEDGEDGDGDVEDLLFPKFFIFCLFIIYNG